MASGHSRPKPRGIQGLKESTALPGPPKDPKIRGANLLGTLEVQVEPKGLQGFGGGPRWIGSGLARYVSKNCRYKKFQL